MAIPKRFTWVAALVAGLLVLGGAVYATVGRTGQPQGGKPLRGPVGPHNAAAKVPWLKSHPNPIPTESEPAPSPLTGILDTAQAPLPTGEYAMKNHWQDFRDGNLSQVFAGAYFNDPSQGLVVVKIVLWPDDQNLSTDTYLTPEKDGALTILSVDGNQITLSSESGQGWIFDLDSRTFTPLSSASP